MYIFTYNIKLDWDSLKSPLNRLVLSFTFYLRQSAWYKSINLQYVPLNCTLEIVLSTLMSLIMARDGKHVVLREVTSIEIAWILYGVTLIARFLTCARYIRYIARRFVNAIHRHYALLQGASFMIWNVQRVQRPNIARRHARLCRIETRSTGLGLTRSQYEIKIAIDTTRVSSTQSDGNRPK